MCRDGFPKSSFGGDAKVVVDAMKSLGKNCGQNGQVLKDIQEGVRAFFSLEDGVRTT
jgi:hypothetical protein